MLLKQGMSGEAVSQLQTNLNLLGEKLKVDGVYGTRTDHAVQRYQQKTTVCVDGKCHGALFAEIASAAGKRSGLARRSTQAHSPVGNVQPHAKPVIERPRPKKKK